MKMTVSYEWLCSLVKDLNTKTPEEIAETFTAIGAETESFTPLRWGRFCKLAQVKKISPLSGKNIHVSVEAEGKLYQTVSNSKRLKEGDFVLFVPAGGEISGGRKVEAKNVEGVPTEGLISALEYLGIEDKSPDIFIFPDVQRVKEDFAALTAEDAVYVLDVSGNRPDWLSVMGLARALAVYYKLDFLPPTPSFKEGSSSSVPVTIESERCLSFSARLITGVRVEPSPIAMQKRLYLLGMRPINNMVDYSNHIMLETGQPSHAYDASVIKGGFVIRQAKKGEKIVLLGGDKEISLSEEDLLICDEEKALGLAGVMGGAHSKVTPETKAILIECAAFHGVHIRRAAKRFGMKTEASSRFEKNISPSLTALADGLFASYFSGGDIAKKSEAVTKTLPPTVIELEPEFVRQSLGCESIGDEFIKKTLLAIGCLVSEGKVWKVTAPSERYDLHIAEDLVEECARFYGYNNLPARSYRPSGSAVSPEISFFDRIRPLMRGMGLNEAVNVSFRSPADRASFRIDTQPVAIENPLTEDFSLLRTHLFDGLVRTLAANKQKAFLTGLAFSEIGRVFRKEGNDFVEEQHLAFALSDSPDAYQRGLAFLNNCAAHAKLEWAARPAQLPFLHPKNSFMIEAGGKACGFFGALHPAIEEALGLENAVACEMDFAVLRVSAERKNPVQTPSSLPPLLRDVTLNLPRSASAHNIAQELKKENPALAGVEFAGAYENPKLILEGRKNVTLRLRFESQKSLNAEDIDAFIAQILAKKY